MLCAKMGAPLPHLGGHPEPPPTPSWLQAIAYAAVAAYFAVTGFREYKRRGRLVYRDFASALIVTLMGAVAVLNVTRLTGVGPKIVSVLGVHLTQLLAVLIVVLFGWAAHVCLSCRNQLLYGCVEVAFGTLSAMAVVTRGNFQALQFANLGLAQCVALAGSVYVVARGLNNYSEAVEKKP